MLLCFKHKEYTVEKLLKIYERLYRRNPEPNNPPVEKIYSNPFMSLVGVTLSAQTRDERTAVACKQLFEVAQTPEEILALTLDELTDLIRPVGMYNIKARNVKKLCQQLIERHNGKVPNDREKLMALAGVGRKSTDIMMRFTYMEPAIAVDTHVHRLCNRLGIAKTKTYDKTADVLKQYTPKKYIWGAHEWLIQHGKYQCPSRAPKCRTCILTDLCDYYQEDATRRRQHGGQVPTSESLFLSPGDGDPE
jgi:endonuclease-3